LRIASRLNDNNYGRSNLTQLFSVGIVHGRYTHVPVTVLSAVER
jgi:hypothetical protein